jgi:hypothetical protein
VIAVAGDRGLLAGIAAMCVYAADSPDDEDVETAIATLGNFPELLERYRNHQAVIQ